MRRLFLFSGMGGDRRLFRKLQLTGVELVTRDHVVPKADESLVDYAERLAKEYEVRPEDVVGGTSFGGMVAAQIAATRPVAGLVLLASTHDRRPFEPWLKVLETLLQSVPDSFLRGAKAWPPLLRYRLGPLTPEAEILLTQMDAAFPTEMLRQFAHMVAFWPGVERPKCPILAIHGARDRLIHVHTVNADIILPDAGHSFTLTHAEQTSEAIQKFLDTLR